MSKIILIDSNIVCNVMSIYRPSRFMKKDGQYRQYFKKIPEESLWHRRYREEIHLRKDQESDNKVIIFKMAKLIMDKSLLLTTNTKCNTDNLLNNMFAFYIAIIIATSGFSITKSIH